MRLPSPQRPPPLPPASFPSYLRTASYESIWQDNFSFNINGSDVMVFMHIQKTGGTMFGKHLVQDIDLETPCICHRNQKKKKKKNQQPTNVRKKSRFLRCQCFRPNSVNSNWLFSRYSIGWKCGLHADWTELNECVDDYLNAQEGYAHRRYFFITLLRNPVDRYLSEFRHVQRGATWKGSDHVCNHEAVTSDQVAPCFDLSRDWMNVTLDEFMSCPTNWAINRQTRMLADLRLVGCYNMTSMPQKVRDKIMLASAKTNLEQMAFFGLTEYQHETQYLFEEAFNLKFKVQFLQGPKSEATVDEAAQRQVARLNHLDVEVYQFAQKLMASRFEKAKNNDPYYQDHFSRQNNFSFKDISESGYEEYR